MSVQDTQISGLKQNTLWALAADGTQVILALASFGILSRFLGSEEFGLYSVLMTYCTLAALVGYVGSQQILMTDLAGGGEFDFLWSRLVSTVAAGGITATLLLTLAQPLLLPEVGRIEFAAIAVSQVLFFGFSEFALVAAQANRKMVVAFLVRSTSGLIRLAAVGAFVIAGSPTVTDWARYALVAWTCSGLIAIGWVRLFFGSWPTWVRPSITLIRSGVPFVIGGSSATILSDADRPMLKHLGGVGSVAAVGVYSVGYRLASFAAIPITALVRASDYDFYAAGAVNQTKARALAIRMTSIAAAYGVIAAAGLILIAPYVDDVLGETYRDSKLVIQLLAPLALIKGLQIFPANALTGSGKQGLRNRGLLLAVAVNIVANICLIPHYSWKGAIIATLVAETVMAVAFWAFLLRGRPPANPTQSRRDQESPESL